MCDKRGAVRTQGGRSFIGQAKMRRPSISLFELSWCHVWWASQTFCHLVHVYEWTWKPHKYWLVGLQINFSKLVISHVFCCCCTVTKSNSSWPYGLQHARPPCPSPSPSVCPCPLNLWCHPTISSSVTLFSFHLQSLPASGSCPMSQLFTSGGQSIGASASAWVLPKSIQSWFPLRLTGLISLQSKGLSRVFSNTTVQTHLFFGTLPSLLSSSHIHSHIIMRTNSSWFAGKWWWFPGRLIDTHRFPNSLLSAL